GYEFVRYTSSGTLDTNFGTAGRVPVGSAINVNSPNLAADGEGRLLVAGSVFDNNGSDFAVARYNTDGSLDTSFGTNGIITTDLGSPNDYGNGLALDAQGRILVTGYSWNSTNNTYDLGLIRLSNPSTAFGVQVNNVAPEFE